MRLEHVALVEVCATVASEESETIEAFYVTLGQVCAEFDAKALILLGDFNSHVSGHKTECPDTVFDFCQSTQMFINTR